MGTKSIWNCIHPPCIQEVLEENQVLWHHWNKNILFSININEIHCCCCSGFSFFRPIFPFIFHFPHTFRFRYDQRRQQYKCEEEKIKRKEIIYWNRKYEERCNPMKCDENAFFSFWWQESCLLFLEGAFFLRLSLVFHNLPL